MAFKHVFVVSATLSLVILSGCSTLDNALNTTMTTVDADVSKACTKWSKVGAPIVSDIQAVANIAALVPNSTVAGVANDASKLAPIIAAYGNNACENQAALTAPAAQTVAWLEDLNNQMLGLKAKVTTAGLSAVPAPSK